MTPPHALSGAGGTLRPGEREGKYQITPAFVSVSLRRRRRKRPRTPITNAPKPVPSASRPVRQPHPPPEVDVPAPPDSSTRRRGRRGLRHRPRALQWRPSLHLGGPGRTPPRREAGRRPPSARTRRRRPRRSRIRTCVAPSRRRTRRARIDRRRPRRARRLRRPGPAADTRCSCHRSDPPLRRCPRACTDRHRRRGFLPVKLHRRRGRLRRYPTHRGSRRAVSRSASRHRARAGRRPSRRRTRRRRAEPPADTHTRRSYIGPPGATAEAWCRLRRRQRGERHRRRRPRLHTGPCRHSGRRPNMDRRRHRRGRRWPHHRHRHRRCSAPLLRSRGRGGV
jgi:hypothetical protein